MQLTRKFVFLATLAIFFSPATAKHKDEALQSIANSSAECANFNKHMHELRKALREQLAEGHVAEGAVVDYIRTEARFSRAAQSLKRSLDRLDALAKAGKKFPADVQDFRSDGEDSLRQAVEGSMSAVERFNLTLKEAWQKAFGCQMPEHPVLSLQVNAHKLLPRFSNY